MTTSGTIIFNPTVTQIVNGALRLVGAYDIFGSPKTIQVTNALEALNLMLKAWQTQGFHWLRKSVTLTLVANQQTIYCLGPLTHQALDAQRKSIVQLLKILWGMKRN